MTQSAHAAIDFQHQHPEIAKNWNRNSNYLIILSVENEERLKKYINKFKKAKLCHTIFREPDIGNEITAICVQPSEDTRKLTSHLPLALKNTLTNTLTNYNLKKLKEEIKVLSSYQKFLKNQRKEKYIVGKRELLPWEASMKYRTNSEKLAAMYVVYGVLRGKDLESEIKNHITKKDAYARSCSLRFIDEYTKKYSEKELV
jgi:peptidyl-tRNA hydrolase